MAFTSRGHHPLNTSRRAPPHAYRTLAELDDGTRLLSAANLLAPIHKYGRYRTFRSTTHTGTYRAAFGQIRHSTGR